MKNYGYHLKINKINERLVTLVQYLLVIKGSLIILNQSVSNESTEPVMLNLRKK